MEEYEVIVRDVTFILEAKNRGEALLEVESLLMDRAHDWGQLEVS